MLGLRETSTPERYLLSRSNQQKQSFKVSGHFSKDLKQIEQHLLNTMYRNVVRTMGDYDTQPRDFTHPPTAQPCRRTVSAGSAAKGQFPSLPAYYCKVPFLVVWAAGEHQQILHSSKAYITWRAQLVMNAILLSCKALYCRRTAQLGSEVKPQFQSLLDS